VDNADGARTLIKWNMGPLILLFSDVKDESK